MYYKVLLNFVVFGIQMSVTICESNPKSIFWLKINKKWFNTQRKRKKGHDTKILFHFCIDGLIIMQQLNFVVIIT